MNEFRAYRTWLRSALTRAVRTIAQTAVALLTTGAVGLLDVDWLSVASASALAGVVSILTSLTGLPEADETAPLEAGHADAPSATVEIGCACGAVTSVARDALGLTHACPACGRPLEASDERAGHGRLRDRPRPTPSPPPRPHALPDGRGDVRGRAGGGVR